MSDKKCFDGECVHYIRDYGNNCRKFMRVENCSKTKTEAPRTPDSSGSNSTNLLSVEVGGSVTFTMGRGARRLTITTQKQADMANELLLEDEALFTVDT